MATKASPPHATEQVHVHHFRTGGCANGAPAGALPAVGQPSARALGKRKAVPARGPDPGTDADMHGPDPPKAHGGTDAPRDCVMANDTYDPNPHHDASLALAQQLQAQDDAAAAAARQVRPRCEEAGWAAEQERVLSELVDEAMEDDVADEDEHTDTASCGSMRGRLGALAELEGFFDEPSVAEQLAPTAAWPETPRTERVMELRCGEAMDEECVELECVEVTQPPPPRAPPPYHRHRRQTVSEALAASTAQIHEANWQRSVAETNGGSLEA